jgi:xanthine dehydrogenase YagR molybdenum-binding subunit
MAVIGKPIDRIDARLKVTGAAKYAAEFNQPQMAYAFPVSATIAKGAITGFDESAAKAAGGVLTIITHENARRLKPADAMAMIKVGVLIGEYLAPLQDNRVHYYGQTVALVVAETYEQARCAAALLKVNYTTEKAATDFKAELPKGTRPQQFMGAPAQTNAGKAAAPLAAAAVKFEQTYTTPTENHHPMEPHATVAVWEGDDKLTLYDATQGVVNTRGTASYFFNLNPENVRVMSPFLGGGFGCKGLWLQTIMAAMAAHAVKRPVKLVTTRQMMQTSTGRRSETSQKVAFGASREGKLSVIRHHSDSYTNLTAFFEPSGKQTEVLYDSPIREITYQVAKMNVGTPTFMRAPGEAPGMFALESALDELAHELKLDPIALRVLNHTTVDPMKKHPFSGDNLRDCYKIGAEKFGWTNRKMQPRMNRNGKYLIGYGMAAATYPAGRSSATARVQIMANGDVKVSSATQDIGTGTYTTMAQTAADALGIPVNKITVQLGDSSLPNGPLSGGSQTTASVQPAIIAACETLIKDLMTLAMSDTKSKLNGRPAEEIAFADAKFFVKGDTGKSDSYADILKRNNKEMLEVCTTAMPASGSGLGSPVAPCSVAPAEKEENSDDKKYSFHSFGAQFAEVWVDEDLGTIRVKRFTSVQDIGRVLNEKTARSQVIGGVIFGIGQALSEETHHDVRYGNPVVRSLGDYHVPVNLDVPEIDVFFINEPDEHISTQGARGVGEIGITGVAAAIANAVFNATGKRLRDLPLTPDKLI